MAYIFFVEHIKSDFLAQWLIPLSATLIGAGLAFGANICHNFIVRKNDRKTKLTALVVNVVTLLDRFLSLKKHVFLPRVQELVNIKTDIEQVRQNIETKPKGIYQNLFKGCQTAKISFDISMFDIGFIAEYDPRLYRLVLILNRSTNDLSKVIEDLNNHINLLSTKDDHNAKEIVILCSYTENAVELIDHCLYFSEIADALLIDLGEREFRPFKIGYSVFAGAEKKFLPPKLGLGWDDLYEKTMQIKEKKNKQYKC